MRAPINFQGRRDLVVSRTGNVSWSGALVRDVSASFMAKSRFDLVVLGLLLELIGGQDH